MDEDTVVNESLATLLKYKDSPGHKAMMELARQQMSFHMAAFMDKEDADLVQTRANFNAWKELTTLLDQRVFEYQGYINRIMEERNRQLQEGMKHVGI